MSKKKDGAKQLAAHYVDMLSGWATVTTRPLFGAIALYRNDHVFAMVWKDVLYFKVDDASRGEFEARGSHPLGYQSKGEERALKSYLELPAHVLEDEEELHSWAEIAYQAALKSL